MNIKELYQYYLKCGQQISTDSRNITQGCLYFALKGNNFDGNKFAQKALDSGAAFAIIDDENEQASARFLLVENVLETLQNLATHHRRQFHIPLIAITGSNGKTTTKELIAQVFKTHYRCHFTQGNFNNHIGVPLTLLAMPNNTEVAIIEMGANHQGEIEHLCEIAEPTHGLITNIGKAHLEGFGGIEGVKKGKSELYRYLAHHKGTAFINQNELFLEDLSKSLRKRIFYHQSQKPSLNEPIYESVLIAETPKVITAFLDKDNTLVEVKTQLYGYHNFMNLMAAITIGKYFKVPAGKIKFALEHYIPDNNRSQILNWGRHKVLLDAYNANPSSMEKAIIHFSNLKTRLPKRAILGDMLELGIESALEHSKIANLALQQSSITQVILVGSEFSETAKDLGLLHFDSVLALRDWVDEQNWPPSQLLLKASRGIALEKLLTTPKQSA